MDGFRPPFLTPEVLPLILDQDTPRVCLIQLGEDDYRAASFLDERMLLASLPRAWVPMDEFLAYSLPPTKACDFIFHIGHVGSTLLARVLGDRPATLALREPAVLRTLASTAPGLDDPSPSVAPAEHRAGCETFLTYLSRTFRPEQRALLKATSFVAEIGVELMELRPTARAILMFVSPQSYLAGILAGEGSRREARANAPRRRARLTHRLGQDPAPNADTSEGELIAMGWLVEILALAAIGRRFAGRVLWLDFDDFLRRPAFWLGACVARLGGDPEAEAPALARNPAFQRYSKGQEHAYDARLRESLLTQAERDHAGEIERGLQWINAVISRHPSAAESVKLVASSRRSQG